MNPQPDDPGAATSLADPGTDRDHLPVPDAPHDARVKPAAVALALVTAAALLYGLLLRVWLLVHLPIWGDEAVVGLMARSIDAGHFSAFYWGQHYGGLEPYVVALGLRVGGGGDSALNGTPAVLAAVAAVLVAGIVWRATAQRLLALAAAGAVWVWPYVVVWQSVREGGFRFATLCCGLTAILCCVRALTRRAGLGTFLLLGIALGLGWWASPEIAYFALPVIVLLWGWWRAENRAVPPAPGRGRARSARPWPALTWVVIGAMVGSLPWWYANAHTNFVSVRSSAFPANGGVTYGEKLSVFFHAMLPLQLGLRSVPGGPWIGGSFGEALYVAVLAIVATALGRAVWLFRGPSRKWIPFALASAVAAYPFLYSAAPGTAYWLDGRYAIYLPTLVVLLLCAVLVPTPATAAAAPHGRRIGRVHAVAAVALAGVLCLTVTGAHDAGVPASPAFFSGWHSGDDAMQHVVDVLRAQHIEDAYGDYWTAYDLDYLSGGQPLVSPSVLDVTRSASIRAAVAASKDPAWLFFAPSETAQAVQEFANPQPGPGPYTEQTFEARLTQLGVPYRVVPLGILDAVVPARHVTVP